jgi:hypothetical protein
MLAGMLAALPSGCGGSGRQTAAGTSATSARAGAPPAPGAGSEAIPPSAVVTLSGHVLTAGDLPAFRQRGPLLENTHAAGWVRESEPDLPAAQRAAHAASLRRLGFSAGVREQLEPTGGGPAEGISTTEQLGSSPAANAELRAQLARLNTRGGFTSFLVPAIPGAHGFATKTGGPITGFNIAFAKGAYYYLVGVGFPTSTTPAPTRAELIAAAQRLYKRVHS